MTMIISYLPPNKIIIDGSVLAFNEKRDSVRIKLGQQHQEDDQVISIGEPGKEIHQWRDIFKNFKSSDNFFFLGYNKEGLLSEVEIHYCDSIEVNDASFSFEEDLESIASKLIKYSPVNKKIEGEYFFSTIKVVLMDENSMGGEGSSLGYFYCTSDSTHLEDSDN